MRHSTWWESNKLINHSKYIVGLGVKRVISCEYCGIFKITCFEEHLRPATSIRCYFDTINLKQSGFCTTYYFKIFVLERKKKKKTQKSWISKKILQLSCNVYVMFYNEFSWFYQHFKSENLCLLNLYSVPSARILGYWGFH